MEKQEYINTITKINKALSATDKFLFQEIIIKAEKNEEFMTLLTKWFKSKCKKTLILRDLAEPFQKKFKDSLEFSNAQDTLDWKAFKALQS